MKKWLRGVVQHGDQMGRTLDFPTANFDPELVARDTTDGIYSSVVKHNGKTFTGALYLGPRITLGETKRVLEIHILDFDGDLYGKMLDFTIETFVRPPRDFSSVDELKTQLAQDILAVRRASV